MSYSSISLLNKYFKTNKNSLERSDFIDTNSFKATSTSNLDNTIITYNKDLNLIFCSNCNINLTRSNYIKHLKLRHKNTLKEYKDNSKLDSLRDILDNLEIATLNTLERDIEPNKYYFKELPLILNGYKCLECNYININYKAIRQHYNLEHNTNTKRTNTKASYILNNIPLQLIEGYNRHKKLYFIPKLPNFKSKDSRSRVEEEEETNSSNTNSSSSINYSSSNSSSKEIASNQQDLRDKTSNLDIEDISLEESSLEDTNISSSFNINSKTRYSILKTYNKEIIDKENNKDFITSIDNNKKILNSFITKSNILKFFKDKNRTLLVNLVYKSTIIEDINLDNNIDLFNTNTSFNNRLSTLEDLVLEFLDYISSKIDNISLTIRQRLVVEDINLDRKLKDFISLDNKYTKRTYFSYFSKLLVFLLRVNYIRINYNYSIDPLELEYYNLVKDLNFSSSLNENIRLIEDYNLISLEDKEEVEDRLDFYNILASIFIDLLKIKNTFNLEEDSNFKNIVINYFYITSLNKNTNEILALGNISKTLSIIIYNSRLISIGKLN